MKYFVWSPNELFYFEIEILKNVFNFVSKKVERHLKTKSRFAKKHWILNFENVTTKDFDFQGNFSSFLCVKKIKIKKYGEMGHSWKASVLTDLHSWSIRVLMKKYCPLYLVHSFLNQMPFLHFPTSIYIFKVNAVLSLERRWPLGGQSAAFKPRVATSCTASHWSWIGFMEIMQLKKVFTITGQFSINGNSSKMFPSLTQSRLMTSWR